jgi:hypothetical protein
MTVMSDPYSVRDHDLLTKALKAELDSVGEPSDVPTTQSGLRRNMR